MNVPRVPAGRVVRTTQELRSRLWSLPLRSEPQFSIALRTRRVARVAGSNGLGMPEAGKPAMHRVRLERSDDGMNGSLVEDNVLYCGDPRPVFVKEQSIGARSLK